MGSERIQPERIRVARAASILGIKSRTVQSMALRGELPGAAKIGGLWTFNENALRKWIEDRTVKPGPARQSTPGGAEARLGLGSRSTERSIDRAYEQALRKWRCGG